MARSDFPDDGTATAGDDNYTYDDTLATETSRQQLQGQKKGNRILKQLFSSCEEDALGSVHRAWAVTVIFMVVFFVVSIIEGKFGVEKKCLRRRECGDDTRCVISMFTPANASDDHFH